MKRSPATTSQPTSQNTLDELQTRLQYRFSRPGLLTLALTHRSFVYDAAPGGTAGSHFYPIDDSAHADPAHPDRDNEQLEFVGDAVLGLLTAEALCRHFPASREGELTRMRASIVSRTHLGQVGAALDLGRWLRLGRTAERNQARSNAALFANAVEALIAALYLDGGLEPARDFVRRSVLEPALPALQASLGEGFSGAVGDHKSALQERLQATGQGAPAYRLLDASGPDHRKLFRVEVVLHHPESGQTGPPLAEGSGPSKKAAQQEAARLAVQSLDAARQPTAKTVAKTGAQPNTKTSAKHNTPSASKDPRG